MNLRYVCCVNQWYKDSPWLSQSCSGRSGRIRVLHRSDLCISIYVYTRDSSVNPNSNTLDPDWLQYDHHTSYGVTQQYFSATFISLLFIPTRKNSVFSFPKCYYLNFYFIFFNCITLMCDLKFHKSESVCTSSSCRMWTAKLDSKKCWNWPEW